MAFVLDASAALPWCFHDESSLATDYLLSLAMSGELLYVPSHWPMEMLNGLTRTARRGRIDDAAMDQFLLKLPDFDIAVEIRPFAQQWVEARSLIVLHRLSAYDTAYLSMAKRLRVPLATLDEQSQ